MAMAIALAAGVSTLLFTATVALQAVLASSNHTNVIGISAGSVWYRWRPVEHSDRLYHLRSEALFSIGRLRVQRSSGLALAIVPRIESDRQTGGIVELPLWPVFVSLIVYIIIRLYRNKARYDSANCSVCGYPLMVNPKSLRCPECGRELPALM